MLTFERSSPFVVKCDFIKLPVQDGCFCMCLSLICLYFWFIRLAQRSVSLTMHRFFFKENLYSEDCFLLLKPATPLQIKKKSKHPIFIHISTMEVPVEQSNPQRSSFSQFSSLLPAEVEPVHVLSIPWNGPSFWNVWIYFRFNFIPGTFHEKEILEKSREFSVLRVSTLISLYMWVLVDLLAVLLAKAVMGWTCPRCRNLRCANGKHRWSSEV